MSKVDSLSWKHCRKHGERPLQGIVSILLALPRSEVATKLKTDHIQDSQKWLKSHKYIPKLHFECKIIFKGCIISLMGSHFPFHEF